MRVHEYLSQSKVTMLKYVLVCVAFIGLVGWNTNVQRRLANLETGKLQSGDRAREKRSATNSQRDQLPTMGGAMFVRWGRRDCPDDSSELVYSGIAGATLTSKTGGSAEYICLTRDPIYGRFKDGYDDAGAAIGGVEYDAHGSLFDLSKFPSGSSNDADVVCAVCRSKTHGSQVMIPGRKDCYQGWKKEYWGYLMTGDEDAYKIQYNFVCVDNTPEGDEKGAKDDSATSGQMDHAEGFCGSLPCPNYVHGRELSCVVCSK